MNIKKIGQFFKKYAFYIASAVVCVGALTAIFVMPNRNGNVKDQANPYAKNEATTGRGVGQVTEDKNDVIVEYDKNEDTAKTPDTAKADTAGNTEVAIKDAKEDAVKVTDGKDAVAENFESTTAKAITEPFFAKGDTFIWPVDGKVVVPYTDESTKHWFSESLNQTMRTFGICIASKEGQSVKAVADGKIIDIIGDSSTLKSDMPYVGKVIVMDNGNGYTTFYGFQGGTPDKNLLGKVVKAGDVIGKAGKPTGAFVTVGSNIYLQATCNKEVINPLDLLDYKQSVASVEADGVDMGHVPDTVVEQ